jgi:hypothetical protein
MRLSVAALALGAACFLSAVRPAGAAETMTLEGAVREALAGNPDLRAARQTIGMARGRLRQAGLWPNPELEFDGRDDFLFGGEGERGISGGFVQRFPISRRLGKARAVARVDIAMAEAELRDAERNLIATSAGCLPAPRAPAQGHGQTKIRRRVARVRRRKRLSVAETSEVTNLLVVEASAAPGRVVLTSSGESGESLAELWARDPVRQVERSEANHAPPRTAGVRGAVQATVVVQRRSSDAAPPGFREGGEMGLERGLSYREGRSSPSGSGSGRSRAVGSGCVTVPSLDRRQARRGAGLAGRAGALAAAGSEPEETEPPGSGSMHGRRGALLPGRILASDQASAPAGRPTGSSASRGLPRPGSTQTPPETTTMC